MMKPTKSEQIVKEYMFETYPYFMCLFCVSLLLSVLVFCLFASVCAWLLFCLELTFSCSKFDAGKLR